ncbi:hypothetical protein EDC01DRAFT_628280 [Geopyxis carbonaria]|nr:hypothetical protein EDC01DRAFT_628280 [Geopyxis carbonaria]
MSRGAGRATHSPTPLFADPADHLVTLVSEKLCDERVLLVIFLCFLSSASTDYLYDWIEAVDVEVFEMRRAGACCPPQLSLDDLPPQHHSGAISRPRAINPKRKYKNYKKMRFPSSSLSADSRRGVGQAVTARAPFSPPVTMVVPAT